jgi:hypothetical protein
MFPARWRGECCVPSRIAPGRRRWRCRSCRRKERLRRASRLFVAKRVDFDHASHFSSVLRGNAGSVDGQRVHVVGFDLGTKAGRAIIGERNAIDDELGLILRASGVEHSVAFVEPARLRIDQVDRPRGREATRVGRRWPARPGGWSSHFVQDRAACLRPVTFTAVLRAAMLSFTAYSWAGRSESR